MAKRQRIIVGRNRETRQVRDTKKRESRQREERLVEEPKSGEEKRRQMGYDHGIWSEDDAGTWRGEGRMAVGGKVDIGIW